MRRSRPPIRRPRSRRASCIFIRNSLDLAGWNDRKALAAALRLIYTAANAETALDALDGFAAGPWGRRFPTVVAAWRRAWTHVIPFFAFPPEFRRVIYTTNALESVHARIRKIIKTRVHFPNDEAATKLIWLALRNIRRTFLRYFAPRTSGLLTRVLKMHSRNVLQSVFREVLQNSIRNPADGTNGISRSANPTASSDGRIDAVRLADVLGGRTCS